MKDIAERIINAGAGVSKHPYVAFFMLLATWLVFRRKETM